MKKSIIAIVALLALGTTLSFARGNGGGRGNRKNNQQKQEQKLRNILKQPQNLKYLLLHMPKTKIQQQKNSLTSREVFLGVFSIVMILKK